MMNIDETIKEFKCCTQIPPDCANCPQGGPGFGIVCRANVRCDVYFWLNRTKEVMDGGRKDEDRLV